jgi:hypothetical protein
MSEAIKKIMDYLEKACTAGTKANRDGHITDDEYALINDTIANLESRVSEMGA